MISTFFILQNDGTVYWIIQWDPFCYGRDLLIKIFDINRKMNVHVHAENMVKIFPSLRFHFIYINLIICWHLYQIIFDCICIIVKLYLILDQYFCSVVYYLVGIYWYLSVATSYYLLICLFTLFLLSVSFHLSYLSKTCLHLKAFFIVFTFFILLNFTRLDS